MLVGGELVDPTLIEAHYRHSPYIEELCVVGWPREVATGRARALYAVVVPDRPRLVARRMVNAGEIVRFEMENRAVGLPPHQRIAAYTVSMAPLPRTASGALDRDAVERRVQQAAAGPPPDLSAADREWMASTQVAPLLDEIRASAREGAVVRPDANLELDLGIDSMARVELIAALEHRAGAVLPETTAQCHFTVRDVVEAVLCGRTGGAGRQDRIDAWTALLSAEAGGPTSTEAVTGGSDRIVWLFHAAVRGILFLSRVVIEYDVSGIRHLPARGPYLICPNHQSYLDPFVLAGHLPFHVVRQLFHVGATEYLQSPLTAWAARQVRLLPVDPDSGLLPAMRASAAGLRAGRILVLFPEGERSIDGGVRPLKPGAAILASQLRVSVVPVALDGLFDLWPRSRPFDWRRLRPWRRHRVTIRMGPPLAPHSTSDGQTVDGAPQSCASARAFTERLRDVLVALHA